MEEKMGPIIEDGAMAARMERLRAICETKIQNFMGYCEPKYPPENLYIELRGAETHLTCHWKFTMNKIDISGAFDIPDVPQEEEMTVVALNAAFSITLSAHPQGRLIGKILNEVQLYAHPDQSRNSLPEVFLRALIGRLVLTGNIPRGQMAGALGEMIHLEQNIAEAFANLNPPRMRH